MGNPFVVCLTSSNEKPTRKNTVFVKDFTEAIEKLAKEGFDTALVTGGGQTDTAALESGLIKEIYLDIEPHIFGQGIPLFSPSEVDLELKFIEARPIGKSGVQLHYTVN